MAWEPMSLERAQGILDATPKAGTMSPGQFARLIEARMVADGADPERIKTVVEQVLGRPLD